MTIEQKSLYPNGGVWFKGDFLGKGGYASVHLAHFSSNSLPPRYQNFPPIVAVKSTSTEIDSLVAEKEIFDALGHSNFLIRCFGHDRTTSPSGQMHYNLFLEYASGGSLKNLMKKFNRGLHESDVRELTRSILTGIYHIHKAGFVHCDIKLDNVLLVMEGDLGFVAKIGDFGLTKSDDEVESSGVIGTSLYLAPECMDQNMQGKEADIWALGCVVFSMLTGKLGWDVCPDVDELSTDFVSAKAIDFVLRCLSLDPADRPTAEMLLAHPFYKRED